MDSQLSLRGDFQNPTGHGSGQSAPADAAVGGVGPGGLHQPQPFRGSVPLPPQWAGRVASSLGSKDDGCLSENVEQSIKTQRSL